MSQPLSERFTDRVRRILELANREARRLNHEYIGTEHILLGLLLEGTGVAAYALGELKIDWRAVRLEIEKLVQRGPAICSIGNLPKTPRAKRVLEDAIDEASRFGHNLVGSEHILLGLLRDREGFAAQVLMNFGLTLEGTRAELRTIYGQSPMGTGEKAGQQERTLPIVPVEALAADSARHPSPKRFTDRVRRVCQLAEEEAKRLNHDYIGTEHLLLGLILEGRGIAAKVLSTLNVDLPTVRREFEELRPLGQPSQSSDVRPRTPSVRNVLRYAIEEVGRLDHYNVDTEHILLGLLKEPESLAAQVLTSARISLEQVRSEIGLTRLLRDQDRLAALVFQTYGLSLEQFQSTRPKARQKAKRQRMLQRSPQWPRPTWVIPLITASVAAVVLISLQLWILFGR